MAIEDGSVEIAAPVAAASVAAEPVAAVPVAEAAPAPAETPAAETAPAEPTVVEGEPKAEEAKAEEPKVEGAAEPAKEAAAEPEKPTYGEFKFPEGVKADPDQLKAFTDVLGTVDVRTQEGAQTLLDLHTKALQDTVAAVHQQGADAFQNMRRDWRENFYKQAGNRADTMANDAKWAIQDLFPKTDERKAFTDLLAATGAGDNYSMVNALAKVARRLRERTSPAAPLPAKAKPLSAAERRYAPRSPTR